MNFTSLEQLHLSAVFSELSREKVVLEIGFSKDYNSDLVVQTAKQVIGMNAKPVAVRDAQIEGGKRFIIGDCANIPLTRGCVDLIVTLEITEQHKQSESMITEIARVLRPGGTVIIASRHPCKSFELLAQEDYALANSDFVTACEAWLRSKFQNVAVFTQRFVTGSYVAPLVNPSPGFDANGASLAGDFIPAQKVGTCIPSCVFLIASNEELPPARARLFETRESSLKSQELQLVDALRAVAARDRTISELNMRLLAAEQSTVGRALAEFRKLRDSLLPVGSLRKDFFWSVRRVTEVLLDGGPGAVWRRIRHRFHIGLKIQDMLPRAPGVDDVPNLNTQFKAWLQKHQLQADDIERMHRELKLFANTPLISVIIPVYNTEEAWLRRAIQSMQSQIYPNWEICLVNDASTKSHIIPTLDEYAASDPRIRVKHLSENRGIAGASTKALAMATGEFVGLLDHDDELTPDALWEVASWLNRSPDLDLVYSDEDKLTINGVRVEPFFKPDWSPDLLLSMNYITHFAVFRRSLLEAIGGFRPGYEGAQDYDLLLRATEKTTRIAHVPKILYHWRMGHTSAASSASAKPRAFENGRRAIEDALKRRGDEAAVEVLSASRYRAKYKIHNSPLVSIIIPTKDQTRLLQQCVTSIEAKTSYRAYEIMVVDNNSIEPEMIHYLDALSDKHRVLRYPQPFNFSALNNFAAGHARGEHLLFLNDDTQVINAEWLTALVEQAQRPGVGAVGAKLLYPDNRIQHAGVIVGIFGGAGHAFRSLPNNHTTYFDLADVTRNCSAVTAACMIVPRKVFNEVGGFDENLKVVYNDVDLCLRIRAHGYLVLYTPFAVLYHFESATRGSLRPTKEEDLFCRRWADTIRVGDPYYNPSLTLTREDWSLRL